MRLLKYANQAQFDSLTLFRNGKRSESPNLKTTSANAVETPSLLTSGLGERFILLFDDLNLTAFEFFHSPILYREEFCCRRRGDRWGGSLCRVFFWVDVSGSKELLPYIAQPLPSPRTLYPLGKRGCKWWCVNVRRMISVYGNNYHPYSKTRSILCRGLHT